MPVNYRTPSPSICIRSMASVSVWPRPESARLIGVT
jgi:hypothetical protein